MLEIILPRGFYLVIGMLASLMDVTDRLNSG
jgi:hypothetical protein